ncbi:MAG: serine/threonine-protein kinase [bacterium]
MSADAMTLPKKEWPKIPGYELLSTMGSGTYGICFKAKQISLDRLIKIKFFDPLPHVTKTQEALERFAQEARIISKLEHPSIETYHNFEQSKDDSYYIVTEYFDGKSVKQLLCDNGIFNYQKALDIMIHVCVCIKYCHDKQVIHRDLKPSHIIMNNEGLVKIVDFGMAYDFEEKIRLISTSSSVGTVPYICPEQRKDPSHRDKRNDIYSIGIILYEMLVGNIPEIGSNYKLVSSISLDVDSNIDTIINNCLKPEKERYQTANALLEELQSLEFLQKQEEKHWEEQKRKTTKWAKNLADQKKHIDIQLKSVKKKIEEQNKTESKIWISTVKKHIAKLKLMVDDVNTTGYFKINQDWEEITERPSLQQGSEGPVIGQINLAENEHMKVRLCNLDPTHYIGNFIQPAIIWETVNATRSSKIMQELAFVITKTGEVEIYGGIPRRRYIKPPLIDEIYRQFLETKLLWAQYADEDTIKNILNALKSSNYFLRRGEGYDIIEKFVQKQVPLPERIISQLFQIIMDSGKKDDERKDALGLLQQGGQRNITGRLLDFWLSSVTQMSIGLSRQMANYFAASDESMDMIFHVLLSSEPINNRALPFLLSAVYTYEDRKKSFSEKELTGVRAILKKFSHSPSVIDILQNINEILLSKDAT